MTHIDTEQLWFVELSKDWSWIRRIWFVATWPLWFAWARLRMWWCRLKLPKCIICGKFSEWLMTIGYGSKYDESRICEKCLDEAIDLLKAKEER